MYKQAEEYKKLKENYSEEILFYQVGIFYKIMFEDARKIADIAGLKLMISGEVPCPVEVCGFPKSGLDKYTGKLLRRGFSVAICNQIQDGNGQIRREVSEVIRCQKV
jgi:DNA mismatch repair protein MutS